MTDKPKDDKELVARQARLEKIKREGREKEQRERPPPELIIRKASEVPSEPLVTLFGGRLILGAFQLMVGPGDAGKGMQSVDIMARLSTGEPFPIEKTGRKPVVVLACVTEDSTPRVKARLMAAGADLELVHFVDGPPAMRGGLVVPSPVALDDDAGALLERARDLHAGALFFEAMVEHLGDREGKRQWSTNTTAEVRRALSPIVALCREARLIGWGVMHPRKSTEGGIEDSISGSSAFRNVGRSVLHVYPDPMDSEPSPRRLLISSKANYLARRPPTLCFRIDPWADDPTEGRVVWGIEGRTLVDSRSAEEVWRQIREAGKVRRDFAVIDAEEFLRNLLANGATVPVDEIKKQADDDGINWITVKRAKSKLKIESPRTKDFPSQVEGWRLPGKGEEHGEM